jgi:hypothetical protein
LFLAEPAEDQDRRDGHGRGRAELGVEEALGARIAGDEGGERRGLAAVRFSVQKASFQARMKLSSIVEAMPGIAIGVST